MLGVNINQIVFRLLRAFRNIYDDRDTEAATRLAELNMDNGAWGFKTMWWCTWVCPKGISATRCIGQIKRAIKEHVLGGMRRLSRTTVAMRVAADVDTPKDLLALV
jgi:hypothetical protein